MFYIAVLVFLDLVAGVEIKSENGIMYYDRNEDTQIPLVCKFNKSGDLGVVYWNTKVKSDSEFRPSISLFPTQNCKTTINVPVAEILCNSDHEYTANIPINKITEGEQWICGGSFQGGPTVSSGAVKVIYIVPVKNVVILNDVTSVNVDEGYNVSIKCQSEPACRPKAELKWYKTIGGEILDGLDDPEFTVNPDDDTLTMSILRMMYTGKSSDNGNSVYCTAKQLSKTVNSPSVRLNVRYQPSSQLVLSVVPNVVIAEITTVNATCYIDGGNPLATLELSCNEKSGLNKSTSLTAISILTFTATSADNMKNCTCTATHPVNSFKRNVSEIIEVQYIPTNNPSITQNPTNPVFENTKVTLTCTVSGGNPTASLFWDCGTNASNSISGNTVTSTISLYVNRSYNARKCNCRATHPVTGYNPMISHQIIVYYAPELPLSIKQEPEGRIDTGLTMNLTCEVTGGNPLANLSWNCGNEYTNNTIGTTSSFSVRVKVDKTFNNKSCTCSALHPVPSFRPTKEHFIFVNYPPSTPTLVMNAKSPLFEGNSTTIHCSVNDSGSPDADFTWMWNMTVEPSSKSKTFQIGPLRKFDNGANISCGVHNEYSDRNDIILQAHKSLAVEYYPIVILKSLTVEIVEGQHLDIECVVLGNPIPKAEWLREGHEGSLVDGMDAINMTIAVVDRKDTGRYQCTAISESQLYGTLIRSKFTELIVYYPPDVHIDHFVNQENEDVVTYVCNATGNPNNYTYMGWQQTYNDIIIRTSNQLDSGDNNKILTLNKPSFSDSGNYTCFVNNGVRDRNGSIRQFGKKQLNVNVSPQLLPGPPLDDTYSTVKGGTINIYLEYFTFPDITNAFWYNVTSNSSMPNNSNNDVFFSFEKKSIETTLHGVKVNVSNFAYQAILKLHNFVAQMEGLYILRLQNGYKDKNITVKAVISSKPEDPSNLNVTSRTSTTITLHWNRGFNGGHIQFFNVAIFDRSGIRLTKQIDDDYNETQIYVIAALTPSTDYVIQLYAVNKINSSNVIQINTTTNDEVSRSSEQQFPVGAIAGGVVGVLIAAVVLMFIFIKRRWSTSREGNSNKKSDRNTLTSSGEDNDGDGLKINDLYVSAGDDFIQSSRPGDVYAVVNKSNGGKHDDSPDMKETTLYAEVNKSKGVLSKGKSKANDERQKSLPTNKKGKNKIEKTKNDDVYENMNEGIKRPISPPNKNKDGLVYADLVFNDNGRRKFVIRGLENKTDYADIDLDIKVDPLPSDESDTEDEHLTNKSNGVQETQ